MGLGAKSSLGTGDTDVARRQLSESCEASRQTIEREPDSVPAHGNLAYALYLLGQEEDASEPLREMFDLGGEEAVEVALSDAQERRLASVDPSYEAFVEAMASEWRQSATDATAD